MVDPSPAFEAAKAVYGTAINGLKELKWENVSEPVRNYIQERPALSALQLAMLLVVTCPGLVLTPMLSAVGLSSIGPVAGEIAHYHCPWTQSRRLTCTTFRIVRGVVSIHLRRYLGLQRATESCDGRLGCWCRRGDCCCSRGCCCGRRNFGMARKGTESLVKG